MAREPGPPGTRRPDVVATAVGAFPELVVPGKTGEIVPTGDATAMAAAVRSYLDDPDRLVQHGQAARRHVLENFRLTQEADRLLAIYRELLETET